jgi:hypothetical protein
VGLTDFDDQPGAMGSVRFGLTGVESNHQTKPVTLSETFSETNSQDVSITGGTCATTLAANTARTLTVTFKPGTLGTESATLSISDTPDPHNVSLTGTGP